MNAPFLSRTIESSFTKVYCGDDSTGNTYIDSLV